MQKEIEVKYRQQKRVKFKLSLPDTVTAAVKLYGDEQVLLLIRAQIEQMARVTARNLLCYNHSPEAVQHRMEREWFATKRLRKSSVSLEELTEEEKEGIL